MVNYGLPLLTLFKIKKTKISKIKALILLYYEIRIEIQHISPQTIELNGKIRDNDGINELGFCISIPYLLSITLPLLQGKNEPYNQHIFGFNRCLIY